MSLSRERSGQIALFLVRLARRESDPLNLLRLTPNSHSAWLSDRGLQGAAGFPDDNFTESEIREFIKANGGDRWSGSSRSDH